MLEDLLQKKVIKLPEYNKHKERNCSDNLRNYKYHHVSNHLVEKYFMVKNLIMKLAQEGIIELDLDDVVELNHTTVTFGSSDSTSSP